MERIERVLDLGKRLDLASMTAIAFHEPKKLAEVEQRYQHEAGLLPPAPVAKARGLELLEELRRGGVLSDLGEIAGALEPRPSVHVLALPDAPPDPETPEERT